MAILSGRKPLLCQIIEEQGKFFIVVSLEISADADFYKVAGLLDVCDDGIEAAAARFKRTAAIVDLGRAVQGYLHACQAERRQFLRDPPCEERAVGDKGEAVGGPPGFGEGLEGAGNTFDEPDAQEGLSPVKIDEERFFSVPENFL